jgi:hypothetical protein
METLNAPCSADARPDTVRVYGTAHFRRDGGPDDCAAQHGHPVLCAVRQPYRHTTVRGAVELPHVCGYQCLWLVWIRL